jgi:protein tyrosine/serine phosphatase
MPHSAQRLSALTAFALLALGGAMRADQQTAQVAIERFIPIERFNKVDERLYRGAQPTEAGFMRLRELGITTVINLRMEPDAIRTDEKRMVEALGMKYVSIPVEDGNFFTRSRTIPDEAIRTFFKIVDDEQQGNVFVHCHRGADRTGALVAFYRIARQGWTAEKAAQEARDLGMRSWYRGLQAQIKAFTPSAAANAGSQP